MSRTGPTKPPVHSRRSMTICSTFAAWAFCCIQVGFADETSAERGYRLLTTKAYLPVDFDQATFDDVWQVWPEPLRTTARDATYETRRLMAFDRYGLTPRPENATSPLQYVVDSKGNWSMNCFACHGGQLLGNVVPGLPNTRLALQTLVEEMRLLKIKTGRSLSWIDTGSLLVPLSRRNGLTNAASFSVFLLNFRDRDLIFHTDRLPPQMKHHDLDAPPWWHFKKKQRLFADGYAEKSPRALMQFLLVKDNGPERFDAWEADFRDIAAYLDSLQPPDYPFAVDKNLAGVGRKLFEQTCSRCHGKYGEGAHYPSRVVPIDEVGTDRVRWEALANGHRKQYAESWFAYHGTRETWADPSGYVAPPLDGVWASAPFFHNGGVPTLWHVLHPDQRPAVWRRIDNEFDQEKVGWRVATYESLPSSVKHMHERRAYFDSHQLGKKVEGHRFPDVLNEDERQAVLEYLKTL